MPVSGLNPGVSPLPTQDSSKPQLTERNDAARSGVKAQDKANDFAQVLNEQSISVVDKLSRSREFDAAADISFKSVYSNGERAI